LALWFISVVFTLFLRAVVCFFLGCWEGFCYLALDKLLAAIMRALLLDEVGRYLLAEKSPTVEA
jgi:hypothetical protein